MSCWVPCALSYLKAVSNQGDHSAKAAPLARGVAQAAHAMGALLGPLPGGVITRLMECAVCLGAAALASARLIAPLDALKGTSSGSWEGEGEGAVEVEAAGAEGVRWGQMKALAVAVETISAACALLRAVSGETLTRSHFTVRPHPHAIHFSTVHSLALHHLHTMSCVAHRFAIVILSSQGARDVFHTVCEAAEAIEVIEERERGRGPLDAFAAHVSTAVAGAWTTVLGTIVAFGGALPPSLRTEAQSLIPPRVSYPSYMLTSSFGFFLGICEES